MVFEDLEAWQASREVVKMVYALTKIESLACDYGLKNQIQRAAVSVMTNIAEGFERTGKQEKLQFYNIVKASSGEVRSLLYVIEDNFPDLIEPSLGIRQENGRASAKLTGLIKSYQKR